MKNLFLAALAAAALAACHERKTEAAPDYGRSKAASERAQQSLDKEAGGN